MILTGKVVKLGDNINTDTIISGRYKFQITDIKELSKHIMEDLDPQFIKRITAGKTILVAGTNFGMGSSREQAPLVIKEAGIIGIIAKNFARIFYRNAYNVGLPVMLCDTDRINDGDELHIEMEKGEVKNSNTGEMLHFSPIPQIMADILQEGGLVPYLRKYRDIKI